MDGRLCQIYVPNPAHKINKYNAIRYIREAVRFILPPPSSPSMTFERAACRLARLPVFSAVSMCLKIGRRLEEAMAKSQLRQRDECGTTIAVPR